MPSRHTLAQMKSRGLILLGCLQRLPHIPDPWGPYICDCLRSNVFLSALLLVWVCASMVVLILLAGLLAKWHFNLVTGDDERARHERRRLPITGAKGEGNLRTLIFPDQAWRFTSFTSITRSAKMDR